MDMFNGSLKPLTDTKITTIYMDSLDHHRTLKPLANNKWLRKISMASFNGKLSYLIN